MKRFIDLIPRYLIKNKKRTLFTAVGIMLSAILITTLSITVTNFKTMLKEKSVQAAGGSYHGIRTNAGSDYLLSEKSDSNIKRVGNSIRLGYSFIENSKIDISAYDKTGKDMQSLTFIEGTYPSKVNEIAMEKWILKKLKPDYKLGDEIRLKYGSDNTANNENVFILSGVLEDNLYSKSNETSTAYIALETLDKLSARQVCSYTQYIELKGTPTTEGINKIATNTKTSIRENEGLMRYYKMAKGTDFVLLFLDIIVVMVSVAVIYNIFNISVIERLHEFGLLRVIGAEEKHIRIIVFGEALILGIIFISIGILIGTFGSKLVYLVFDKSNILYKSATVPVSGIISAYIICFLTIFVSVYFPSKYVSSITPIEALNITGSTNMNKDELKKDKSIKFNKKTNFSFGMALINMKRNKNRFWATVVSLTISIMLLVVASSIVKYINPINFAKQLVGSDYVLGFNYDSTKAGYSENVINEINSIKGIKEIEKNYYFNGSYIPPTNRVSEEYKKFMKKTAIPNSKSEYLVSQGKYWVGCEVFSRSEDKLREMNKLLEAGNIDIEAMKNGSAVLIQNLNNANEANVKVGDEIELGYAFTDKNKAWKNVDFKVKVGAILNEPPFTRIEVGRNAMVLLHEDFMKKNFDTSGYQVIRINTKGKDKDLTIKNKLQKYADENRNGRLVSFQEEMDLYRRAQKSISIILYSFIFVTSLIGVMNIINTISMNIVLRKREFGMLRAIGMDNTQIKNMILFEGIIYGVISAVLGCGFGFGIYMIIYRLLRRDPMHYWFLSYEALIGGFIGSIVIAILASIGPLKRLLADSVIESIRTVE